MNIAACILAVIGAALSIFQDIHIGDFAPGFSLFKALQAMTGPNSAMFNGMPGELKAMVAAIAAAAVIALIGAYQAYSKSRGMVLLVISAAICLGIFFYVNNAIQQQLLFASGWMFQEIALWGAVYLAAAVCCFMAKRKEGND